MPCKNPAQRLRGILDDIDLIGEFTCGLACGGFVVDTKTVYAVVRALGIVSKAEIASRTEGALPGTKLWDSSVMQMCESN